MHLPPWPGKHGLLSPTMEKKRYKTVATVILIYLQWYHISYDEPCQNFSNQFLITSQQVVPAAGQITHIVINK